MNTSQYKLPVLLYHRVVNNRYEAGHHNIYIKRENLVKQFDYLRANGYITITFRDFHENKQIDPYKKIILTFDDGYVDNYTLLFPLLKEYGFKAVIFLVTQLKRNEWGIVEGEPAIDMMNEQQIKEMDDYGIEFGGHTQTHADLLRLSGEAVKMEVAGCKKDIEKIINKEVISFSYPFGGVNENIKRIVRETGYYYGISTDTGPGVFTDDLMQIKRVEVSCKTKLYRFRKKASGMYFEPSVLGKLFKHYKR